MWPVQVMGEKYVMPPVISFEAIYEQSTTVTPIVFILSPGSDPAGDLMKLAERSGFGAGKLKYLSLGQGQEKVCDDFEFFFASLLCSRFVVVIVLFRRFLCCVITCRFYLFLASLADWHKRPPHHIRL